MKRSNLRILAVSIAMICAVQTFGQVNQGFNFQAVARSSDGTPLTLTPVEVVVSILNSDEVMEWEETYNITTSNIGHFSISIGADPSKVTSSTVENLNDLNWNDEIHYVKVEVDGNVVRTDRIMPVPLAMYGKDEDADPSNEIQTLSQMGNTISLSNGGGDVTITDNVVDGDNNPNNEIQNLTQSGNKVTLSDGGGTISVDDADANPSNEIQTLTRSGSTAYLSGGGSISINDGDYSTINELQGFSLSGSTLSLTTNEAASSVNLGSYVDGRSAWSKTGSTAYMSSSGKVGIGTSAPAGRMEIINTTTGPDDPIFQVKNNDGVPVFAVYNEGVRILFPDDVSVSKGLKGGFAVGGYNSAKATETGSFLEVMPQGADINFFTDNTGKGVKGGFAVGGYQSSKGDEASFVYMDPYAAPIVYDPLNPIIIFDLFSALSPKGNCYIGTMSGQNQEGHYNTSIGYQAGFNLNAQVLSYPMIGSTNANSNTFLGAFAGYANDLGDKNVFLGYQAGYNNKGTGNVCIGYMAGATGSTYSNLLYIDNEDTSSPLVYGDFNSNILEVNGKFIVDNGQLHIADNPGSTPTYYAYQGSSGSTSKTYAFTINDYLWVTRGAEFDGNIVVNSSTYTSDKRYKKDINPLSDGLEKVLQMKGVSYYWDRDKFAEKNFNDRLQIGFIAQDMEKIIPEIVLENSDGYKSIDYSKVTAVLVEAVKEQQTLIEAQQQEIEELKARTPENSQAMIDQLLQMQETIDKLSDRVESMERYTSK